MRIPYAGSNIIFSFSKTIVSAQRGDSARLRVANNNYYSEQQQKQQQEQQRQQQQQTFYPLRHCVFFPAR